jgi:hypothetical protein
MTVPLSGILTMEGLAQEALYGTYGSGTITSPIHMYDLVNGGNSAGSGNSYPAVNQNCLPNPAYRVSYQIFYVDRGGLDPEDYWTTKNPATDLAVGDQIYTSSTGTPLASAIGEQINGTATDWFGCSSVQCPGFVTNSSGVITSVTCQCPV